MAKRLPPYCSRCIHSYRRFCRLGLYPYLRPDKTTSKWVKEMEWNEELIKTEPGSIETTQIIPNPNKYLGLSVSGVRILAATVAGIVFLLCLYLLMLYMKFRPAEVPEIDKEAQRARKKYKDLIVDIRELPEIKGGETLISLGSLDDLITAAEELLKPVLHKGEKERHTYCAIDGLIRYQYVSEPEPPDRDKLGSSG